MKLEKNLTMKALSPRNEFLSDVVLDATNGRSSLPATSRHAHPKPDSLDHRPFTSQTFPSRSSKNPYFVRNNPHPSRVKHIKGLLDSPICMVESVPVDSTPSSSLKLQSSGSNGTFNLNSLQASLRPPVNINAYRPKEKAIPRIGLVPITEDWRDQLRRIAHASGLSIGNLSNNGHNSNRSVVSRQQSRNALKELEDNYVRNVTTRDGKRPETQERANLVSRASERPRTQHSIMSNHMKEPKGDVLQSLDRVERVMEHIASFPDNESYVFQMLGRILQTDSADAVRNWLVCAPDREKDIVAQMIQAIASANSQPVSQQQEVVTQSSPRSVHDPIYEDQLLQYESSIDVGEIESYQQEEARKRLQMRQKPQGQSESGKQQKTDHWVRPGTAEVNGNAHLYEWSLNSIANKPSTPFKTTNAQNSKEAEIEDIRSKLASRGSVRVFSHQSNRSRSQPERPQSNKPATANGRKSDNKPQVTTLAPFSSSE